MSLTQLVKSKEVRRRFAPLRPSIPRTIDAAIKVEPHSKRYTLVGTAFDYLLRFELNRQAPHAESATWIAEQAIDGIWKDDGTAAIGHELLHNAEPSLYLPPDEIASRARAIVDEAKADVSAYLDNGSPTQEDRSALARHAILLAKLDPVFRAGQLDPHFQTADSADIEDLIQMLDIVPLDKLVDGTRMILNPAFGESSKIVGGADSDLISGDLLVDFKVSKAGKLEPHFLDQLLGYLLLAKRERSNNSSFPQLGRLGIYFCRHGFLWTLDVKQWMGHPQFGDIETWFFSFAEEFYGNR